MGFKMFISKKEENGTIKHSDEIEIENSEPFRSTEDILSILHIALGTPQKATPPRNEKGRFVSSKDKAEAPIPAPTPTLKEVAKSKPEVTTSIEGLLPAESMSSRKVELLGSKTTGFPIAEKLKRTVTTDPNAVVNVLIDCPACNHKGNGTTRLQSYFKKCVSCKEKLRLTFATDHYGEANEDGFTFIADSIFVDKHDTAATWEDKK